MHGAFPPAERRASAAARLPTLVLQGSGLAGTFSELVGNERRRATLSPITSPRYWWTVAFIGLAYFTAALMGDAMQLTGNVDVIWPPVGVGVALLLVFGVRFWPGIVLGDALADLPHALPFAVSAGQTFGNLLEVVIAVALVGRLLATDAPLARLGSLGKLTAALLAATALSATIGTASLWLGGAVSGQQAPLVWRTWWLGDSCGALVVVPLAVAWLSVRWPRRRPAEVGAVVLALAVVNGVAATASHDAFSYLTFPVFIWAALRFGPRGGTLAVGLTAIVAIWAAGHRLGQAEVHSIDNDTLRLQLYLGTAIASTLFASVLANERRSLAADLASSRSRLIQSTDKARRQLERDLHDGAQQHLLAIALRLRDGQHAEDARALMESSASELLSAIDELREIAHGIHPSVLTESGLTAAIDEIAARSTVPVEVRGDVARGDLDPAIESTAYYVVAEAIANAQRHARATHVLIDARVVRGRLRLEVRDDGVGGAAARPGSGLEGLRDRVEGMHGSLRIASPPGGGTSLVASLRARA